MKVFDLGSNQLKTIRFICLDMLEKGEIREGKKIDIVILGIVKLDTAVKACSRAVNIKMKRKEHRLKKLQKKVNGTW